jgi:hypothetical protein
VLGIARLDADVADANLDPPRPRGDRPDAVVVPSGAIREGAHNRDVLDSVLDLWNDRQPASRFHGPLLSRANLAGSRR